MFEIVSAGGARTNGWTLDPIVITVIVLVLIMAIARFVITRRRGGGK